MKSGINDSLSRHIVENKGLYFVVTLFFAIGIAAGAFTVKALDFGQKQDLVVYLNRFFQLLDKEQVNNSTIFYQSIKNNFQTVLFVWILSISIVGAPITLFINAFRGFIIGFTISFLIQGLGWKGLLFITIAILPQNVLYIPCLLVLAAISLGYSLHVFKEKFKHSSKHSRSNIYSYTLTVIIIFGIMCIGSSMEAYISPILLKSLSGFMVK